LRDIGPMRAAWREALLELKVQDRRSGYPVETVVRAADAGWRRCAHQRLTASDPVLFLVVCARITRMDDIDIGLFDRDWNNTIYYFVMNGDEQIYMRYGGRDARAPDSYLNLSSLELALEQGLDLHHRYQQGDLKKTERPKPLFPREIPPLVEQAAARGKPLTALMLDIDYFKSVNDTYGHDAGDDVLREFATRIKKSVRGIDLACRLGGEEFVIIMPETDMAVATIVAERLRRRIASEPFAIAQGTKSIEVTISIGLATLDTVDDNAATILKRADQALYRAKRDGRNRVVADAA
jgi:diguanylate cyclase (GGDEF)-like protein